MSTFRPAGSGPTPANSPPPDRHSPTLETPILEMRGITKLFPGVRALSDVTLTLRAGRVTALIGENGAGKSTLVKTMTGIYRPDGGDILIDGRPVAFSSPAVAEAAGITAIHQETVLFDELTVAENIFLGHAPKTRFGLVDWKAANERAAMLLRSLDAPFGPRTRLKDLSIGQRQMIVAASGSPVRVLAELLQG